jgi:4-hydroxybenzoate polyprenyltransferase
MSSPEKTPSTLPDAAPDNWVDAYMSQSLRPWLKLGRIDRPVGIWLLFLPGVMGLLLASKVYATALPAFEILLFFIGAVLMRAAGCAFNDLIDLDIDAKVARTRTRPLASGQISRKGAIVFIVGCCLISLLILLQLGSYTIGLGVASLALVAIYPFMKRITWWPQVWLGLTFNWGFLMGFAAIGAELSIASFLFYSGLVFWTIGYDTIYALQDIEDDALIGVGSSARALGPYVDIGVRACYFMALILTCAGAALAQTGLWFYVSLILVLGHILWQLKRLQPDDTAMALELFKSNQITGLLWVLALAVGRL